MVDKVVDRLSIFKINTILEYIRMNQTPLDVLDLPVSLGEVGVVGIIRNWADMA